jgi:hypothetical protein
MDQLDAARHEEQETILIAPALTVRDSTSRGPAA